MLPDFEALVEEIRSKRRDLEWSQQELAKRAGVSQSLVAKLERRENVPNYRSVRKLYRTLETSLSSDAETAGDLANPEIVSVKPSDIRRDAAEIMRENDFSQLPVESGGDYVGIVLSKDIVLIEDETPVEEIMRRTVPLVPDNAGREAVAKLLETNSALLVKGKEGIVKGIITSADLL